MTDKELLELYPFLKVDPEYNYIESDETGLYSEKGLYIPEGWYDLFLDCCAELREALLETNELNEFKINQLKEKYGEMRIYTNFTNDKIGEIIRRYEIISQFTCCVCGKIARYESKGWICPFCEDCKTKDAKYNDLYGCYFTKFEGDLMVSHHYTHHNIPLRLNEVREINEETIECSNGKVIVPSIYLENEEFKEYISSTKTVGDVNECIRRIFK